MIHAGCHTHLFMDWLSMIRHKQPGFALAGGIALFGMMILFLPFKLPYSITVPGKIVPAREWVVVQSRDGILSSVMYDNVMNYSESSGSMQVNRGDQSFFRFQRDAIASGSVAAGDTIGSVYSYDLELMRAQLKGELGTALAMLALYESGEKEPLVREARFKLDYAEMQVEQQKKEIARLNRLAEKSMIPPAEMERQETALKLYEIKVETAKAALNTLETGYKKEQIDLEHAHIQALRDQIEVLEKRLAYSHIIAPITGRLVHSTASDTLAIVQDTARYVVVLPVKWRDRNLLKLHEKVTVRIEGLRARPVCEVSHISTDVWMMGGSHLVRVAAILDDTVRELSPGLGARCSIACQPVGLFQYLILYFGQ